MFFRRINRTALSWWAVAVFLAGMLSTVVVTSVVVRSLDSTERARFDALADSTTREIETTIDEYVDAANALAQVVAVDPDITEREFQSVAAALVDPDSRSGLSDLNWLPVVEPGDIGAFEESQRKAGRNTFTVSPRTGETAVVVTYRYSAGEDRPASFGADARSFPFARRAIDRAARLGSPAMTEVYPMEDHPEQGVVIVYVPVLGPDGTTIGFTNALVRGTHLYDAISLRPGMSVQILDLDGVDGQPIATRPADHEFAQDLPVREISLLGRHWGIIVDPGELLSPLEQWLPWLVLAAGALFTSGITALGVQIRAGRQRAERLVEVRTAELVRANEDLSGVNQVGQAILATLELDVVLQMIARQAAQVIDADACALFLVDHAGTMITHRYAEGIATAEIDAHTYEELAEGISGTVWRTAQATRSRDIATDLRNTGMARERGLERGEVSLIVAPIMEDGRVAGTLSVLDRSRFRAFSDADQTTIELLAAQASIAIRNARLYSGLVEANERLTELNALKDDFVANISHEFRTPLTVVSGAAEMLDEEPLLDVAVQRELVRKVRSNTRRLDYLVQDVLLAAHIDVRRIAPSRQTFELAEAVETVAEDLAGPRVENRVPDGVRAYADRTHVERILINLLTNAFKYGRPPFEVSAEVIDGSVEISVRDHGDGIPEDLASRLFERFEQGDRGSTRRSSGVGLGLHIVSQLAELNGGVVESVGDATGARFVVRLPSSRPVRAAG